MATSPVVLPDGTQLVTMGTRHDCNCATNHIEQDWSHGQVLHAAFALAIIIYTSSTERDTCDVCLSRPANNTVHFHKSDIYKYAAHIENVPIDKNAHKLSSSGPTSGAILLRLGL